MSAIPLYLTPRLRPALASLLQAPDFLHDLVAGLGSPLNVVLPEQVADNVDEFRAVYRKHHMTGDIYFAHKANRASSFVRNLAATSAAMDVASLGELQHALGAGFAPERIMATGPKSPEFLWLAARSGIAVNLDSRAELAQLAELVRKFGLPKVRILVRLSGFETSGTTVLTRVSRFGTPMRELDALLDDVVSHQDATELIGVAYHLDTIGLAEKAAALEGCIKVMNECQRRGLRPRVVDIGGGFGVNYLDDGDQWERWTSELTNATLGRRAPLTWQSHGYGLRGEGGTLRGALGLYPSHRPVAGPRYLDELLSLEAPTLGRPLATLLLENLFDLYIEPGRALVDQSGTVLATVLETRQNASGDWMVRLEMNAGDASLEEHGVLLDPVLVERPGGDPPAVDGPTGVYLIGNLCLEADFITRRQVFLPKLPRPGDLLAFANTAGYFMDFSADHALHQPIARKVAAYQDAGRWRWCLDEQYWPTARANGADGQA
ncbi:Y4yA family PLP-dependent enzyme [Streptomyces sp. NPDC000070]|uniref:Y4yA family PLP-dependent enzyme n=1 Tax=Streptomyces sp. NPDC000070 TaxID=3154240 RepID=UPI00332E6735